MASVFRLWTTADATRIGTPRCRASGTDGRRDLFTRWIQVPGVGWKSDIFAGRPDGSGTRPLLDGPTNDSDAVWSPDGSRIAFVRSTPDGKGNGIHVMDADGTGITNLTPVPGGITNDEPAWSPDGQHIAFRSNREGMTIFVMRADGSDVRRLVNVEVETAQAPSWSPDGGRIVFSGRTDERHSCSESSLSVVHPDGSGLRTLPSHPSAASNPVFSPDGSKIAYGQGDGYKYDLFVMNADGSGVIRLTDYSGFDGRPVWSPDASAIAFASDRGATAAQQDGKRGNETAAEGISVYVISVETGVVSRVTEELEDAYPSSWR
jgi:TolB protein